MLGNRCRVAFLISGSGTTMEQGFLAWKQGRIPYMDPVLVISSKPDVKGLERARAQDVPALVLERKGMNPAEFEERLFHVLLELRVDLIAQCGWTVWTPDAVTNNFSKMSFNQHCGPTDASRPGFGGKGMRGRAVHHAVLHFATRINHPFRTEAVVHRVISQYDGGTLLGTRPVAIKEFDDAESIQQRVLPVEHQLVIETLVRFTEGRVVEVRRVEPLIRDEEKDLLLEAIEEGRRAYPNG